MNLRKLISTEIQDAHAHLPEPGREKFIRLDLNESYYFLDETILADLRRFEAGLVGMYPSYSALNSKLARYTGRAREEICLTDGSDHAIAMLVSLFFGPGDRVVVPSPTFFVYYSMLDLVRAKAVDIGYTQKGSQFQFPFAETMAALKPGIKGLLLCNPNNPLGTAIPADQLTALVKKTHALGIPVIIDEAYFEFYGHTSAALIQKYENLIIIRSFSKAFGLAGLRLGYVLASREVIDQLVKLRLQWAVNHFAVSAGETVLGHRAHFKVQVREVVSRRRELVAGLKKFGYVCVDTDTNFILVRSADAAGLTTALRTQGILVQNVSGYPHSHGLLSNTIRVSVPSEKDMPIVVRACGELQL
jgi:histidinol-phosphate aminotransferase